MALNTFDKPVPYTSDPNILFLKDVALFLRLTLDFRNLSLLSIIWPILPIRSNLDELAFTRGNVWAISVHVVLIVVQLGFFASLAIAPCIGTPVLLYFAIVLAFIVANKLFCDVTLNGPRRHVFYAGGDFAQDPTDPHLKLVSKDARHAGERWVFINGVAVG
jgi:hypothetical protein